MRWFMLNNIFVANEYIKHHQNNMFSAEYIWKFMGAHVRERYGEKLYFTFIRIHKQIYLLVRVTFYLVLVTH